MTDQARDASIDRAARAFREQSHGRSDAASSTRARILASQRRSSQRATLWLAAAAALVLGLGVPTAWAWSTGRLDRWLGDGEIDRGTAPNVEDDLREAPGPESPADEEHVGDGAGGEHPAGEPSLEASTDEGATRPSTLDEASGGDDSSRDHSPRDDSHPGSTRELADRDPEGAALPDAERSHREPGGAQDEALEPDRSEDPPVDPAERLAFQRADALHSAREAAAAIDAWDAYLARYPEGRFAIEARYARALCLVRLGRTDQAREALAPFAEGRYGRYREAEASALIEALAP